MKYKLIIFAFLFFATACSVQKKIATSANETILKNAAAVPAHLGICVYEPATNKYLFNYQHNKYFVPASNTKLFSMYAGLKLMGDSLPAVQYFENNDTLYLLPTGDPTFLHPDFTKQPVKDFLMNRKKIIVISSQNWKEKNLGYGWAWDDYNEPYMTERSPMPIYGNTVRWIQVVNDSIEQDELNTNNAFIYSEPEVNWQVNFSTDTSIKNFSVKRKREENEFFIQQGKEKSKTIEIPFATKELQSAVELLEELVERKIIIQPKMGNKNFNTIFSQPLDSLLKPMMHRSDNFFAEQILLMASNKKLGIMNDEKIVQSLLNNELSEIPQKPKWVDGSGLSRYNLFTPQSFVWLINKMIKEFGIERMKNILPTGGQGTLRTLYLDEKGFVFAKTGTLSGHSALSGFLITKKNRLLIFSVLANNYISSSTDIRKAVEQFIKSLRNDF